MKQAKKVIIGNKKDLVKSRDVDFDVASNFAKMNDCDYFECSAKKNDSVDEIFETLNDNLIQNRFEMNINQTEMIEKKQLDLSRSTKKLKYNCCSIL